MLLIDWLIDCRNTLASQTDDRQHIITIAGHCNTLTTFGKKYVQESHRFSWRSWHRTVVSWTLLSLKQAWMIIWRRLVTDNLKERLFHGCWRCEEVSVRVEAMAWRLFQMYWLQKFNRYKFFHPTSRPACLRHLLSWQVCHQVRQMQRGKL